MATGGVQRTFYEPSGPTLFEGGSGNIIAGYQARGALGVGLNDHAELRAVGRYGGWGDDREAAAPDVAPASLGSAYYGVGLGLRVGIADSGPLTLDWDFELETLDFPVIRSVRGKTASFGFDEDEWESTPLAERVRRDRTKSPLVSTGLHATLRIADQALLLAGASVQARPRVYGYQVVETTCDAYDCTGPEGLDEIPTDELQAVYLAHLGAELELAPGLSLIGLLYTSYEDRADSGRPASGLDAPGASVSLRFRR